MTGNSAIKAYGAAF